MTTLKLLTRNPKLWWKSIKLIRYSKKLVKQFDKDHPEYLKQL